MKSVYYTQTPLATVELGARLGRRLQPGDTVLLFGDLGAGKTHFVKGIAAGLGVTDLIKSPTYAYVNTYPLAGGNVFFHYDFYRLASGDDFTSLGYEETLHNPRAINVIEWADRLGERLPARYLRVDFAAQANTRSIALQFAYPLRAMEVIVEPYYNQWQTPLHVRGHCRQVALVARQVAEAFVRAGEIVDINLVYTSALLHDMCRVCDFRRFSRELFTEEVTDEKWAAWVRLREQYAGRHHADIAHEALLVDGFDETAEAVRLHRSAALEEEPDSYDSLEKKIVYYADKRVKHTEVVSLAERFRDGRERYGKEDDAEHTALYARVEARTYALEKSLFKNLEITPEEVKQSELT